MYLKTNIESKLLALAVIRLPAGLLAVNYYSPAWFAGFTIYFYI
jgi:hypothetical protein